MLVFTGGRESEADVKDSICRPLQKHMSIPAHLNEEIRDVQIFDNFKISTEGGELESEESEIEMEEVTETLALDVILEVLGCRLFVLSLPDLAELENLWDEW